MKKQKKVIALNFPPKNSTVITDTVTGVNIFTDICGNQEYEDTAYLSSGSFSGVFGKTRSKSCRCRKLLSILRIRNKETGYVIYRKYEYNPNFNGLTDDMIALHPASIRELVEGNNAQLVGKDVEVSKGCSFCYFWNHPYHATRISMRLGIYSICLALLSIILTLILSGCCS
ncbi:MAG: hypothetical protein K5651_00655 [Bacteroidales bacterium]|nr:hypothetical protein [Bacteroidales bacterium]